MVYYIPIVCIFNKKTFTNLFQKQVCNIALELCNIIFILLFADSD